MTDEAFIARMRGLAIAELRAEYPYMKSATLEKVASDVAKEYQRGVADQAQEMQATKSRSNFFTLPREIRDEIYELAVTPGVCSDVPDKCVVEEGTYEDRYFPLVCHTSRQVRQEVLPIYLGKNKFTVWIIAGSPQDIADFNIPLLREWAQFLGMEKVAMNKNLAIHVDILSSATKKIGEAIAKRAGATFNDLSGSGAEDDVKMWDKNVLRRAFSLEGLGFSQESVKIELRSW